MEVKFIERHRVPRHHVISLFGNGRNGPKSKMVSVLADWAASAENC